MLGIVDDKHGLVEHLFSDVSFVFRLKVKTPLHRIDEFFTRFFQNLNGFGVVKHLEFTFNNGGEFCSQTAFKCFFKESNFFGAFVEDCLDDVFDHAFSNVDDVGQFCKCHFRLNLPKLCCVTRGVGVFCTESRAKGVNLAHCHCCHFPFKLSADGEASLSLEEVCCHILCFVL